MNNIVLDDKLPGEVLPYIGYTGTCMCHWKGYGFQAIYSGIRSRIGSRLTGSPSKQKL